MRVTEVPGSNHGLEEDLLEFGSNVRRLRSDVWEMGILKTLEAGETTEQEQTT